jgi:hypothetical protein
MLRKVEQAGYSKRRKIMYRFGTCWKTLTYGLLMGAALLATGELPQATGSGAVTVLCNDSYLRSFLVFQTPVMVGTDGQIKPVPNPKAKAAEAMPDFQSPLPPADWIRAEFDDAHWERNRAPIEAGPESERFRYAAPANSLICARARFMVQDPGQVSDLKLALVYVGGVVVYVNGQEVARGDMPSGEVKADTSAMKVPDDLYCEPDGTFVQMGRSKLTNPAGFERRYRRLVDVAVPGKLLRKGMNVLAVEVHRAPINEAAIKARRVDSGSMKGTPGLWAYAGLKELSLTCATGSALAPNVGRPAGIQVWNCAPSDTVTAFDYSDGSALQPVMIVAPRNGVFSGRLAVSSDQPIKGLTVVVSTLAQAGGAKLPATAVVVRCAEAGIPLPMSSEGNRIVYRYNALLDAVPPEIAVVKASHPKDYFPVNYLRVKYNDGPQFPVERKNLTGGAVAPIWITARVPKDAAPGLYQGTVTVSANGLPATVVPLLVAVSAWTQPDPREFRIVNFGQQSPDSLALHYNVPLWSERHFELMGRSMALMSELNSRQAPVELAIDFYGVAGNRDTMVRWIKQADGSFKYDFTIFDKYLDTVAKYMGKPAVLRMNCWEDVKKENGKIVPNRGRGRTGGSYCVTVIDPATGKLEPMDQPLSGTEESFVFWKPVLDEVRKRVEARGWWDVAAMGFNSYHTPALPEQVSVYKRIWPDGVWSFTSHAGGLGVQWPTTEKDVKMLVRYADVVWNKFPAKHRGARELLKPRPGFFCYTFRTEFHDFDGLSLLRDIPEEEITCGHDGVSDFGVDFFPFQSKSGRMATVGCGRGTGGPENSTMALLAPGRDGPLPTERYEAMREGVELGEAILFLERSLQEKKVGGELAARVNRFLDERSQAFLNRWPSGRWDRDEQLIALAGEVATAHTSGR